MIRQHLLLLPLLLMLLLLLLCKLRIIPAVKHGGVTPGVISLLAES